jgi:hypothetical protein
MKATKHIKLHYKIVDGECYATISDPRTGISISLILDLGTWRVRE